MLDLGLPTAYKTCSPVDPLFAVGWERSADLPVAPSAKPSQGYGMACVARLHDMSLIAPGAVDRFCVERAQSAFTTSYPPSFSSMRPRPEHIVPDGQTQSDQSTRLNLSHAC